LPSFTHFYKTFEIEVERERRSRGERIARERKLGIGG